jgi:hypothetical protein
MSQHIFMRGRVRVVAGWDRPLQEHFLTVTRDGDVLYSNLTDPALEDGGGMSAALVIEKLLALRLAPPPQLFEQLRRDERDDVGNAVNHYSDQSNRSV